MDLGWIWEGQLSRSQKQSTLLNWPSFHLILTKFELSQAVFPEGDNSTEAESIVRKAGAEVAEAMRRGWERVTSEQCIGLSPLCLR